MSFFLKHFDYLVLKYYIIYIKWKLISFGQYLLIPPTPLAPNNQQSTLCFFSFDILRFYIFVEHLSGIRWINFGSLIWVKKWKSLNRVWLLTTHRTIQSMEISSPEYWSGWPLLSLRGSSQPRDGTQISCIAVEPPGQSIWCVAW